MNSMKSFLGEVRSRFMPYWVNNAMDWGLLPGQRDYTRFIILARSRSGSNFLRGLLNSHPQIIVYGEIFQNKQNIGWALPGFSQGPGMLQLFHNQPVNFIESKVFKKFPHRVRSVGFKIFYYHARDTTWQPVWEYLSGHREIKVLHIKRRNLLRTHLSRKVAMLNDVWVNTTGENQKTQSLSLDYAECLRDFEVTRHSELEQREVFSAHPYLEIDYEDLAADYRGVMGRILNLLEVENTELRPETHKQSSRPLSETIENYVELKTAFRGSPWEIFFEE